MFKCLVIGSKPVADNQTNPDCMAAAEKFLLEKRHNTWPALDIELRNLEVALTATRPTNYNI